VNTILNCSRRAFFQRSACLSGGLVLGVYLPALARGADATAAAGAVFAPNAWIRIGPGRHRHRHR
jgi:hypothetical protein